MYRYTNIDVLTVLEDSTPLRSTRNYLPTSSPAIELSVGEVVMVRVTIEKDTNFLSGQFFNFNSVLFQSPSNPPTPLSEGVGWLIYCKDNGVGGLVGGVKWLGDISNKNYELSSISVVGTTLSFNYKFYCTTDIPFWGGSVSALNSERFTKTIVGGEDSYNNSYSCAYTRNDSNVEITFFECDVEGRFLGGATDYICRDLTNPSQDSFLIPCGLKWYDEKLGGGSGWVNPTTKESDYLKTIEVDSGGATNRVELNFRAFPFKSNFLDSNFQVKDNVLAYGGDNEVRFIISTPSNSSTNTNVLTRLLREGDINEDVDFVEATGGEMANIPQSQPLNTSINKFFGTPSSWSGGGDLAGTLKIDGNAFDVSKVYRMGVLLVDTVADKSSAHQTPTLGVGGLVGVSVGTITGIIETYNNTYTDVNDLSVCSFERHKLKLELDANLWANGGLVGFQDQLKTIQLISNIGTQTIILPTSSSSSYNFQTNQSSGLYNIVVSEVGGVYTIEAEIRAIYGGVSGQVITHTWGLNFIVPSFPQAEEVSVFFPQIIRVKSEPQPTVRLQNLFFLEYDNFLAGVRSPLGVVCKDDGFVVVEVPKNGAPNMNLQALFFANSPSNPTYSQLNLVGIEEEEIYLSANLQQLSSNNLDVLNGDFNDPTPLPLDPDKAYFLVNLNNLTPNQLYTVGVICIDI